MSDYNIYPYLPNTKEDKNQMLSKIGVGCFEDLLKHIDPKLRVEYLNLPEGLSEIEIKSHIESLANKNKPVSSQISFLGAGSYYRYIPSIVSNLTSRSEFVTAYTPYQPEVSQGSLQAIYEYQTAICRLTGMEVSNASMYDGATACAEACLMAFRIKQKPKVAFSQSLNPEYKNVVKTYCKVADLEFAEIPNTLPLAKSVDFESLKEASCIILQQPNFLGLIEDLNVIEQIKKKYDCLVIVVTEPISLATLRPPGHFNADIVVGDAQSCGNGLSFGGPSAGYMATKKEFVRHLPGRIVGATTDKNGKRAFTLTLQTREQHIRRANANSNICTNQALNALTMLIYLSTMGPTGLNAINELSFNRAHYLAQALSTYDGVSLPFGNQFLNEFVLKLPIDANLFLEELEKVNILGGINLGNISQDLQNHILIAVTEMNTKEQLQAYINAASKILMSNKAKMLI